jgi:signal transduction histidine kinase
MSIDALRASPLLAGLPDDELERLGVTCEPVRLAPGERLIAEGTPGDSFFVVLAGELEVTKRSGESEVPLAVIGRGEMTGEMAVLEGGVRSGSVTARTEAEVLRIPAAALYSILASPDAAMGMLRTVMGRLRSTEALLREREKLAGLGTLAAGLAHELNNPAAALRRTVIALEVAVGRLESHPRPPSTPRPSAAARRPFSALERAERVDELAALSGGDVEGAAALVDAGWSAEALGGVDPAAIAWLAADASVRQLLGDARLAAERIGEIVAAVKGYAYLDRAPVQRIDVRTGLDQTLVILRHRLKHGIEITRRYADDLPEIEAYGSELNQVWTNLVDNAIDAMDGNGRLDVDVEPSGEGGVTVRICDSGAGIPDDVRSRLFEPFYTTKPQGKGTGLGLHISHQAVVRHGGRIDVESRPGRTCFIVTLPATLPR